MTTRRILIMAGGTGGHIMPGLAVAQALREQGWQILWLGNPERMEGDLVPARGFEMAPFYFSGVRGKGLATLLKLPFTLIKACMQARKILREYQPDVVLGMGGYVAFPGGLMARLSKIPLIVHEQNAIAGTANRLLARFATRSLTGFPGALPNAVMVGNPVRAELINQARAQERYANRTGSLEILIVGGSLGAASINKLIPQALASVKQQQFKIRHQSGKAHYQTVVDAYAALNIDAEVLPFIDDMAQALSAADIVVCRAGAMTVAEVAAVGVAALFIPLPNAIDDHQTANARYLSECGGAWMMPQNEINPAELGQWLASLDRDKLAKVAMHAHDHASLNATALIAEACIHTVEEK